MNCPDCHADDNTGVFFLCGTDSAVLQQSEECKRRVREAKEDNSAENRQRIAEDADFDRHTDNKIT